MDHVESLLRLFDSLTLERAAADVAAKQAESVSTSPDADTEAGRLRGYAEGLKRAMSLIGDVQIP